MVRDAIVIKKGCVLIVALLLSACASDPVKVVQVKPPAPVIVPKVELPLPKWSESNLLSFHDQWKGTPYRLGGLSRNGIDCSGFVYLAYLDIVGEKLPRSVNAQRTLGKDVPGISLISVIWCFLKPVEQPVM